MIDVTANGHQHAADVYVRVEDIPRWIPVSERLPQPGERTLICEHGEQYAATFRPGTYRDGSGMHNRWESDECETYNSVTHWMPLPEPPSDGK
jgi:hypothetical protein